MPPPPPLQQLSIIYRDPWINVILGCHLPALRMKYALAMAKLMMLEREWMTIWNEYEHQQQQQQQQQQQRQHQIQPPPRPPPRVYHPTLPVSSSLRMALLSRRILELYVALRDDQMQLP